MKFLLGAILVSGIMCQSTVNDNVPDRPLPSSNDPDETTHPVVLELFTSEGCSSCPPADQLLPGLAAKDPLVVPLSFHVDYWNYIGWTDPFSNKKYSDRQYAYGRHFNLPSVYTPQLVINGKYEVVGSDKAAAEKAIGKIRSEHSEITIRIEKCEKNGNQLDIGCHLDGITGKQLIIAAIVQQKATVAVKRGENKNRTLTHTNVVRSFASFTAEPASSFVVDVPGDLEKNNREIILYTQDKTDLHITGCASRSF